MLTGRRADVAQCCVAPTLIIERKETYRKLSILAPVC